MTEPDAHQTPAQLWAVGNELAGLRDRLHRLGTLYANLQLEYDNMAEEVNAELDDLQRRTCPCQKIMRRQARQEFLRIDMFQNGSIEQEPDEWRSP